MSDFRKTGYSLGTTLLDPYGHRVEIVGVFADHYIFVYDKHSEKAVNSLSLDDPSLSTWATGDSK